MGTFLDSLYSAVTLIGSPSAELVGIVVLTLKVSGVALALAALAGLPLGTIMGLRRFPLKGLVIALLNAFMGLPPVIVGLFLFIVLSKSGPLGFMGMLYTPDAMVAAQFILAFPIVTSLTHSSVTSVELIVRQTSITLGASGRQTTLTMMNEARYGILSAVVSAFGRVMAEVGAVLIVGGNIAGHTRVMTTTIATKTDKGDFSLALALGIILLTISIAVNIALYFIKRKSRREP